MDGLRQALLHLRETCSQLQQAIAEVLRAMPPEGEPQTGAVDFHSRLRAFYGRAIAAGVDAADLSATGLREGGRALYSALWKYHFLLDRNLREEGGRLVEEIAAQTGVTLVRDDIAVPSAEPEGTILVEIAPGRRAVSCGRTGPAADAFLNAARAAGAARAAASSERAAALEELMKLWREFAGANEAKEPTLLRYAVNAVHALGAAGVDPLLRVLKDRGISEIPVEVGASFDESYSPNRYERRRMRSPAPRNTIVGLLQRGFVGPDGATLQRAVVVVSDGE